MNANHKEIGPEGPGLPGKTKRPAPNMIPAGIFHAPAALPINTGASARWKGPCWAGEPRKLSGFVFSRRKPLKRLVRRSTSQHRAKAPVLMRGGTMRYEICGLLGLIAVLNLLPAGRVTAQTFTILHSFTASNTNSVGVNTNGDGANPYTGLIANSSRTTLYGTARGGGNSGNGTVFAVNTDGTGFTNLHSFSALGSQTNSDGAYPSASLILSGNALYGTAANGGSGGSGTVFALNTNGTGFTNLHSFTVLIFDPVLQSGYPYINSDGAYPIALILSGNTLYGTADEGGSGSSGVLFSLNSDGTGFTNLHTFQSNHYGANEDGVGPNGLILSGSTLYGTADLGAFSLDGTVFAFNSDGAGFTTLHGFTEL